jgi:hypothetical protein
VQVVAVQVATGKSRNQSAASPQSPREVRNPASFCRGQLTPFNDEHPGQRRVSSIANDGHIPGVSSTTTADRTRGGTSRWPH